MTHDYELRAAGPADLDGARSVMLDTFYHDLGYGYRPEWHADVIDLEGVYLRDPRHGLFVAVHSGQVVATTAVRAAGPKSPSHPAWLAERYPDRHTAQLFRVYVRPEHRRRGLGRGLVELARAFVANTPGYGYLYLHTDTRVPGAEAFWRSLAAEVHDDRDSDAHAFQTVHFEIP
ncbi:GNAT family N-acetyltransferase [Streptosporangium pseudovulgare]|uniref:N-acetyltransferase n=1 Tax=Streptosporangium pseudovulgare TaxID=35765 RepID=A0ABQ2R7B3_9ACTN|nr:GNAT family N-acetyltransferase [Streptosporangium pseudovulgare]GGQ17491.1 N-acetyltransferase [Streptosporangium pseudovulgare]